ncbi:MAG TPA: L,D-transpeptidase, partial [Aliiroseovarius sp.]|nr:L,D-transpeptidase [Aliiroseovarius sp.]
MSNKPKTETTRRKLLIGAAAFSAFPAPAVFAQEQSLNAGDTRHNISSFRVQNWQDHFETLRNGAILCDTTSRMVQFWSEDESIYKVYPSSVPISEELTRLGYTSIIRKVVGPSWRPTPSMKLRNPEWPDYWPPGPDNPLGTHALYLSWQYYRIHGTGDTRKIG